jgi:hypothetical protein
MLHPQKALLWTLIHVSDIYVYIYICNVVGIATGYRLDDEGFGIRVSVGSRIFSSPRHPDQLWGPPSLL